MSGCPVSATAPLPRVFECRFDADYCTGSVTAPLSNNKFGSLEYPNIETTTPTTANIKDWIIGIGTASGVGALPIEALSNFDRSTDSSIRGLGTKMEKIYNSQSSVPLTEFGDPNTMVTSGVEQFVNNVDSAIQISTQSSPKLQTTGSAMPPPVA